MALFHQLHKEGVTIVMVTHDLTLAKEAEVQENERRFVCQLR